MDEMMKMSLKKKIILLIALILFAGVTITLVMLFAPDPMPVDWTTVKKIPSRVELLEKDDDRNPTQSVALVRYLDDDKEKIDTSDWKILQFTDMHLTKNDERDDVSLSLFIETLEREQPDFVVLTGDIITRPQGRPRAIQLAEIFEKMGIYWCYCLGNHEGDSDPYTVSRKELIRIFASYPHCLVEDDVKKNSKGETVWGLGNTTVNLLGADHEVVQSLIFLDSGNKISEEDYLRLKDKVKGLKSDSYDFLKESQIVWFEDQVKDVTDNYTKQAKAMLFIHIPLVQQYNADFLKTGGVVPEGWSFVDQEPLMADGNNLGQMIVKNGWNVIGNTAGYEYCHCSPVDGGMYDKMKELRTYVNGLFCGHDHINNTLLYEDYDPATESPIYLCYGTCSGLQSYNMHNDYPLIADDYHLRGYTELYVHCDEEHFASFSLTHVRYENTEKTEYISFGKVAA